MKKVRLPPKGPSSRQLQLRIQRDPLCAIFFDATVQYRIPI